jgi:hypothetical protein
MSMIPAVTRLHRVNDSLLEARIPVVRFAYCTRVIAEWQSDHTEGSAIASVSKQQRPERKNERLQHSAKLANVSGFRMAGLPGNVNLTPQRGSDSYGWSPESHGVVKVAANVDAGGVILHSVAAERETRACNMYM